MPIYYIISIYISYLDVALTHRSNVMPTMNATIGYCSIHCSIASIEIMGRSECMCCEAHERTLPTRDAAYAVDRCTHKKSSPFEIGRSMLLSDRIFLVTIGCAQGAENGYESKKYSNINFDKELRTIERWAVK